MKKYNIDQYPLLVDIYTRIAPILSKLTNWRLVGGVVRDGLSNKTTNDIDVSTTNRPDMVEKLFHHNSAIGKRFGTIMVFVNKLQIEITTTRKDINPTGRFTDVEYTNSFYEDSCRRDFTFNSLYMDNKYIYDYHNGLEDLQNGIVRFIGNPGLRIKEDYLRIFRYVRFFIRYSKTTFDMYESTIMDNIDGIRQLSKERIISEIDKILNCERFILGLQMLHNYLIFQSIYTSELNITHLDETRHWTRVEKLALIFKDIRVFIAYLPKQSRQLIEILNNYNVSNLGIVWHKYKHPYYAKFLIRYHMIDHDTLLEKLLDKYWYIDSDFSHISGEERGQLELEAKNEFIQKNST